MKQILLSEKETLELVTSGSVEIEDGTIIRCFYKFKKFCKDYYG